MTTLIIYLIIGVISNLLGPLSKKVKEEIMDVKNPYRYSISNNPPGNFKIKVTAFVITLRILVLCLYPIGYVILFIDRNYELNQKHDYKVQEEIKKKKKLQDIIDNKSFLYFRDTHGGGLIKCHGCGYTEEIIGFTHGFGNPCPYSEGSQCQRCGKFMEIDFLGEERVSTENCSCGGKLSREKPIFCPRCKTRDVSYQWIYVT